MLPDDFQIIINDWIGKITTLWSEIYIVFFITLPVSFLIFIVFNKLQHKIIVNLGDQKWLIKND